MTDQARCARRPRIGPRLGRTLGRTLGHALGLLGLAASALAGCDKLWGGRVVDDDQNCKINPAVCSADQICSDETESCEARPVDMAAPADPPADLYVPLLPAPAGSFLSPGEGTTMFSVARPMALTIATDRPAVVYYTLDGSRPVPGTDGTLSGDAPVRIRQVADGATLTWSVDYGARYERTAPRAISLAVSASAQSNLGFIPDNVVFTATGGPVAAVAPATPLTLTYDYQSWRSDGNGYCPGCILQLVTFLVGPDDRKLLNCVNIGDTSYPGGTHSLQKQFAAPTVPGTYTVRLAFTFQLGCDGSVPGANAGLALGQLIVQ